MAQMAQMAQTAQTIHMRQMVQTAPVLQEKPESMIITMGTEQQERGLVLIKAAKETHQVQTWI